MFLKKENAANDRPWSSTPGPHVVILPLGLAVKSLPHLYPPLTLPPDGLLDHMLQVAELLVPWPGLTADPFLAPGLRQSWLPFRSPGMWAGVVLLNVECVSSKTQPKES